MFIDRPIKIITSRFAVFERATGDQGKHCLARCFSTVITHTPLSSYIFCNTSTHALQSLPSLDEMTWSRGNLLSLERAACTEFVSQERAFTFDCHTHSTLHDTHTLFDMVCRLREDRTYYLDIISSLALYNL